MARFLPQLLAVAMVAGGLAKPLVTDVREHNPTAVPVTKIHMVLSSHFDAGCKTPGCGKTVPGEPVVCAKVGAGNAHGATDPFGTGEPWAYHIINRYFDEFIPKAIQLATEGRAAGTKYTYMTQSWVASLYLDCANAGMLLWPEIGSTPVSRAGQPSLHCPNASAVAAFKAALQRKDIFFHAFAHDGEASVYPDASLFEAGIEMGERICDELGIPRPTSVSQRDVPGWTRAAIPLLSKHGVNGISFGAGTPPGKVDVPPLSVWRDVPSNTEVVLTYETAYGTIATLFVLPNGEALCVGWDGDNTGPAPLADVQGYYKVLQDKYPSANVSASTFDEFFAVANRPEVKALLPVVTGEIEDGWIYGVPSDPLKNAQFREASRQRLACLDAGTCSKNSPAMQAFERLLVKVPEHTWGVAQGWFLPDYDNYTNAQFDKARAQQPFGFVADNRKHADYNTTVNSWIEQRAFVTQAPLLLEHEYPELAANLSSALTALKVIEPAKLTAGLAPTSDFDAPFSWAGMTLQLGPGGGLVLLKRGTRHWADPEHPLGQFLYESYDDADYNFFLKDFGSRIGDKGAWPQHTAGQYAEYNATTSDAHCGNFCKKNMSSANPVHRSITPTVVSMWKGVQADGSYAVVTNATLSDEAHAAAGAPANVVTKLTLSADGSTFDWDVIQVNKRPTRLPEATFFTFKPTVPDPNGWGLTVLGSKMDPLDVLGKVVDGPDPMSTYLDSVYGGSPHLRGVEDAHYASPARNTSQAGGGFKLTSLDVPIICTGKATPFVSPRTGPPDMAQGVSWNIFQNIWNTNYVLWYPFEPSDPHTRSRFRMQFK